MTCSKCGGELKEAEGDEKNLILGYFKMNLGLEKLPKIDSVLKCDKFALDRNFHGQLVNLN